MNRANVRLFSEVTTLLPYFLVETILCNTLLRYAPLKV